MVINGGSGKGGSTHLLSELGLDRNLKKEGARVQIEVPQTT